MSHPSSDHSAKIDVLKSKISQLKETLAHHKKSLEDTSALSDISEIETMNAEILNLLAEIPSKQAIDLILPIQHLILEIDEVTEQYNAKKHLFVTQAQQVTSHANASMAYNKTIIIE